MTKRFSVTVFASRDRGDSYMRSLEFNENNKQNPSAIANAELGPWTRAGSEWSADLEDVTDSAGVGFNYAFVPEKVLLDVSYTRSRGSIDIVYAGFGVTNWNGAPFADRHQFGFRTPPTIQNDLDVLEAALEVRLRANLSLMVGYMNDRYETEDWQQEADTPWFESVGSEYLLRDSSRSHQWGNRLINMGSYLAPSYRAHVGYFSVAYRF